MATNTTIGSTPFTYTLTAFLKAVADHLRTGAPRRAGETDVWTHGARGL